MIQLNSKTKTSSSSKSPKKPPTLPTNLIEKPLKTTKTKGGVNLTPLISAVLLAAVRLGLEKKRERLASSKTR
jgi:hypothetical protein